MGIRFTCPECEKRIHVKSFLAGKRGICPKCGGKVEIPAESQTQRSQPAESGPPVPPGGYPTAAVPTAAVHTAQQVAAIPSGPGNQGTAAVPYAQANTAPQPQVPVASVTPATAPRAAVGQAAGSPALPQYAGRGPQAIPANAVGPAPVAHAVTQPVQRASDPLSEEPAARWYVRPPGGGQFGPAAAEVMRRWLGEGRVSAEALVWREGWPDWRRASNVFPDIAGPAPEPMASTGPVAGVPVNAATASAGRVYRRRKNSNALAMGMVITLAILAIGLLVGVIVVVANQ